MHPIATAIVAMLFLGVKRGSPVVVLRRAGIMVLLATYLTACTALPPAAPMASPSPAVVAAERLAFAVGRYFSYARTTTTGAGKATTSHVEYKVVTANASEVWAASAVTFSSNSRFLLPASPLNLIHGIYWAVEAPSFPGPETWGAAERLTVPAGDFMVQRAEVSGSDSTYTFWVAPPLLIRQNWRQANGTQTVTELEALQ